MLAALVSGCGKKATTKRPDDPPEKKAAKQPGPQPKPGEGGNDQPPARRLPPAWAYITDDFVVAVVVRPRSVLESKRLKVLADRGLLKLKTEANAPYNPRDLESLTQVEGPPRAAGAAPNPPPGDPSDARLGRGNYAYIYRYAPGADLAKAAQRWLAAGQPTDYKGRQIFRSEGETSVMLADSNTLIQAPEPVLRRMIDHAGRESPLRKLMAQSDLEGDVVELAVIPPLREWLGGDFGDSETSPIIAQLWGLAWNKLYERVRWLKLVVDFSRPELLRIEAEMADAKAANLALEQLRSLHAQTRDKLDPAAAPPPGDLPSPFSELEFALVLPGDPVLRGLLFRWSAQAVKAMRIESQGSRIVATATTSVPDEAVLLKAAEQAAMQPGM